MVEKYELGYRYYEKKVQIQTGFVSENWKQVTPEGNKHFGASWSEYGPLLYSKRFVREDIDGDYYVYKLITK